MKHLEIEFKWEANCPGLFSRVEQAAEQIGARLGAEEIRQITDVYLDHPSRDFEKEKLAFRLRQSNQQWEVTFKTRTEIVHGKAVRREETCPVLGVKNLKEALAWLYHKKQWKGLALSGLETLFKLQNYRRIYPVSFKRMQAELVFDTCRLHVCGRRIYFKEIELELKKGSAKTLEEFSGYLQQQCKLKPAVVSKVKTAVSLMHLWGG